MNYVRSCVNVEDNIDIQECPKYYIEFNQTKVSFDPEFEFCSDKDSEFSLHCQSNISFRNVKLDLTRFLLFFESVFLSLYNTTLPTIYANNS
jgi:hypothetical protein